MPQDFTDLPPGYRWATEEECERYAAGDPVVTTAAIVVSLTTDAHGTPYTQGEADLAMPEREV